MPRRSRSAGLSNFDDLEARGASKPAWASFDHFDRKRPRDGYTAAVAISKGRSFSDHLCARMACQERQIDRVGLLGVTDFLPSPQLVQQQLNRSVADRQKMRHATDAFYKTWKNLRGNAADIEKLGRLAVLKTTSFNVELAYASFLGRDRNEGPDPRVFQSVYPDPSRSLRQHYSGKWKWSELVIGCNQTGVECLWQYEPRKQTHATTHKFRFRYNCVSDQVYLWSIFTNILASASPLTNDFMLQHVVSDKIRDPMNILRRDGLKLAIHARRGDSCNKIQDTEGTPGMWLGGRNCWSTDVYRSKIKQFIEMYGQPQLMILASDSGQFINDMIQTNYSFPLVYLNHDKSRSDTRVWVEQNMRLNHDDVVGAAAEVELMSFGNSFIGTMVSLSSRLMYQKIIARTGLLAPFLSIDRYPFCCNTDPKLSQRACAQLNLSVATCLMHGRNNN